MVPGGVTESINHFAGMMRIFDDPERVHSKYDDGPAPHRSEPGSETPAQEAHAARDLDTLDGRAIRIDYQPGDFHLSSAHPHKIGGPPISVPQPHLAHVPFTDVQAPEASPGGGEIQVQIIETIVQPLAPAPTQLLAAAHQLNILHNDGVILMAQTPDVIHALAALHHQNDVAVLDRMIQEAKAPVPAWLPPSVETQPLIDAVRAHDADPAAHTAPAIAPGIYVDGAVQPAGTPFDPHLPVPATADATSSHNGMTDPGLDARTGGNTAVNVASIIDDNTQHSGLVVLGNSYTTDAIVQTNVLKSTATIDVGGTTDARTITTDGNTAHNLASFAQHDTGPSPVTHFAPNAHVQIDTINGNFYDVKGFEQVNAVSNNDVVVQGTMSTYYQADTGDNTQINDLPFSELNQNYDLIIVHGSFHNANYIVQQNVFLNDDVIKAFTGRGDTASQTINTGGNTLQNSASIDHYGTTTSQPLSSDMIDWITRLENGDLDPALAEQLPGNGSSVAHVLVVKGDFYDINYLSQTNIVSNADTVVQYLPNAGSPTAANGATTTSTMSIDSGNNHLANLASIAVVGTTGGFQLIGGQHYDDAILVQANLVSDTSHVRIGDTHALVSEVVAFTGLHDVEPVHDPAPVLTSDPSHHHDLFHGLMT